jgi:hypothetical protein
MARCPSEILTEDQIRGLIARVRALEAADTDWLKNMSRSLQGLELQELQSFLSILSSVRLEIEERVDFINSENSCSQA